MVGVGTEGLRLRGGVHGGIDLEGRMGKVPRVM